MIDFKPRQTPTGAQHGIVCANIAFEIKNYLEQNPVGRCFGAGTGFFLEKTGLITLDAAFVRNDRFAEGVGLGEMRGAPDVAIIVIAPTDKFDEIEAHAQALMNAGSRHVWLIRPRVRMVTVHHAKTDLAITGESEALTAEDVMPGFRLEVKRLFAGL